MSVDEYTNTPALMWPRPKVRIAAEYGAAHSGAPRSTEVEIDIDQVSASDIVAILHAMVHMPYATNTGNAYASYTVKAQ